MRINREGHRIILISGLFFLLCWTTAFYLFVSHRTTMLFTGFSTFILFLWLYIITFFREPKRVFINDSPLVFSPCDGRVVAIEKAYVDEYMTGEMIQISIFMPLTNIHMNWYPVSGKIEYVKYHPGKFLMAWLPKSSKDNEHTTTVIRTEHSHAIMFRQIAGFIARRIVTYAKPGTQAIQNRPLGFVKFGSRMDVFVPLDYIIHVKLGDRVIGNQIPLARVYMSDFILL